MCVEKHKTKRPVNSGMRAELAEHDCVIAAQTERVSRSAQDGLEMTCDLLHRPCCVARGGLYIPKVCHSEPPEYLNPLRRVVRTQSDRSRAHCFRTKSCSWSVRDAGVERNPENGDIDAFGLFSERAAPERSDTGETRRLEGI
jgi:hypothetical protein